MASPLQLPDADARKKKAALETTIADRLGVARSFTEAYGSLTSGIAEFIEFLVCSGRIAGHGGSQWWRGVNGMLIADLIDAREALRSPATPTLASLSPAVQHWIGYARHQLQRSGRSLATAQRLWWKAHQTSLHAGIRAFRDLLLLEPPMEINFIAHICVPNVDLTAILGIPTSLRLIKLYTLLAYPHHYPARTLATLKALILAPASYARLVGASSEGANIGLDSTRWDS